NDEPHRLGRPLLRRRAAGGEAKGEQEKSKTVHVATPEFRSRPDMFRASTSRRISIRGGSSRQARTSRGNVAPLIRTVNGRADTPSRAKTCAQHGEIRELTCAPLKAG